MKKRLVMSVVATITLGSVAWAAEGRIPVLSLPGPPYIITAPGYYLLTRNIGYTSDSVIEIRSDDVTLDLGGHTVTGPGSFVAAAIGVGGVGPGVKLITIKNGRIVSGSSGVDTLLVGAVRLEGLDVSGSLGGLGVNADHAEVVDCHVHDLVSLSGSAGAAIGVAALGGRVTGNLIQNVPGSGIILSGFRGGEVRHNVIRNFGSVVASAMGIDLEESGAPGGPGSNVIADNTVDGTPGSDDEGMEISSFGNLISGNIVSNNGTFGIYVKSNDNRLERNVTNLNGSDGISLRILLQGNRFDANQSQLNKGCGLNLTTTVESIYSNGTFYNNSGGNVCGTGINAGGNYCDATPCP